MTDEKFTPHLNIRLREIGSNDGIPISTWGIVLNNDLEKLDAAIGEVCTPEQIEQIRARLPLDRKGMVL